MEKIINFFIENPEKEFHIRGLAKIAKKSPTTISKYLKDLKNKKILVSRKKLNHLLFKANVENPLFKDLKIYYNIKRLRKSGLIEYLTDEFNNPEAIILFGSFAKGEDIPKSDIDILVITPLKKKIRLDKFEKIIGNEIQLFLHSNSDLEKMKDKNKELLNSFINGIVLEGFWEIFE